MGTIFQFHPVAVKHCTACCWSIIASTDQGKTFEGATFKSETCFDFHNIFIVSTHDISLQNYPAPLSQFHPVPARYGPKWLCYPQNVKKTLGRSNGVHHRERIWFCASYIKFLQSDGVSKKNCAQPWICACGQVFDSRSSKILLDTLITSG